MTEPAARLQSPTESTRTRLLHPVDDAHVRMAEFRAQVRAAGESWVAGRPGELVAHLLRAAADDPELAKLVRAGGQLVEDFVEGLKRRSGAATGDPTPVDLAAHLIGGRELRPDVEERLATTYLVAVVRPQGTPVAWDASSIQRALPTGTLQTRRDTSLVLLVPDEEERCATSIFQELVRLLGNLTWVGTSRQPRARLPEGFGEAEEIARLAAAGRRPGGVYRMDDVLVEYAVTRHDGVTANLLAAIRPLRSQTVLWQTLSTLIDADYVRNHAAKALFIHRSTLDYRLQRIAQLTGHDPTTGRGAQVLTAAMIADAMQ